MDHVLHPPFVAMPELVTAAPKKSCISLLLITIPLLPIAVVVVEPFPKIAFVGKLAPDGPISQLEIVLLSLPLAVTASVEKKTIAPFVATDDDTAPLSEHLVIVLLVAPPIKRMVDVPVNAETVVFSMVSELPLLFNPSTVTLSAPLKSINVDPPAIAPLMVRAAPPDGEMVNVAHGPVL